jgi:hypothetical protein
MVLSAHLPDFAAGLDTFPGRGRQVSDGQGGYWILDIDEPVPGDAYVLRPGLGRSTTGCARRQTVSLSALAPRERVRIALKGTGHDGRPTPQDARPIPAVPCAAADHGRRHRAVAVPALRGGVQPLGLFFQRPIHLGFILVLCFLIYPVWGMHGPRGAWAGSSTAP